MSQLRPVEAGKKLVPQSEILRFFTSSRESPNARESCDDPEPASARPATNDNLKVAARNEKSERHMLLFLDGEGI
ncbi:MAG: hypothetical protein ACR2OZ_07990 [Verrucomicrobiales bacterium]